jgi:hypothetical protein
LVIFSCLMFFLSPQFLSVQMIIRMELLKSYNSFENKFK